MIGLGIGMTLGGRAGTGGAAIPTLAYVTGAGANGATASPSGLSAGDLLVGVVLKATTTAPTHDPTGGALIGSWSSGASSGIAFWKYAESSTPAFGTHTGGSRCEWFAARFSEPPVNPIGASDRISGGVFTAFSWCGLTLQKSRSMVFTVGYRAANEAILDRTGALAAGAATGVSSRYKPMRSNGEVASWPQEDLTQTVAGVFQSIAIEVGY